MHCNQFWLMIGQSRKKELRIGRGYYFEVWNWSRNCLELVAKELRIGRDNV